MGRREIKVGWTILNPAPVNWPFTSLLLCTSFQLHKYKYTNTSKQIQEKKTAQLSIDLLSSPQQLLPKQATEVRVDCWRGATRQNKTSKEKDAKRNVYFHSFPLVRSPGPLVLGFTGAIWLFAFVMWTKMANGEHIPKCENITVESVNKCISTGKRGAQHRPTEVNIFTTFAKI